MSKQFRRKEKNYSSLSDEYIESKNSLNDSEEAKTDKVRVSIKNLNIRKGPGKEYDRTGEFTGPGIFEISERSNGYGKLSSGEGWISLDFCEDIE